MNNKIPIIYEDLINSQNDDNIFIIKSPEYTKPKSRFSNSRLRSISPNPNLRIRSISPNPRIRSRHTSPIIYNFEDLLDNNNYVKENENIKENENVKKIISRLENLEEKLNNQNIIKKENNKITELTNKINNLENLNNQNIIKKENNIVKKDNNKILELKNKINDLENELKNYQYTSPVCNFNYELPIRAHEQLHNEVKKEPDIIINEPNGMVIYRKPEPGIEKHVLKDEEIYNCNPKRHPEFLYTTIVYYIDPKSVSHILKISESIIIDLLKNHITVRSGSITSNYAILKTIIDLNESILQNEYIKLDQIQQVYEFNIDNSDDNFKKNKNYVIKKTLINQNSYSKYIKSEFHAYCNPKGC